MESGKDSVKYEEEFITNSRGNELFTCRWMPTHMEPKALVFMCHGYGTECSISMRGIGVGLATEGYAVYGMEYEGHGHSSGLRGHIPNYNHVIDDCSHYFTAVSERQENKNKKKILLGESYGGGVVLHLHLRRPDHWVMAVLLAPLCKFAEKVKPHPLILKLYVKLAALFPKLKLLPDNLTDEAVRVPKIKDEESGKEGVKYEEEFITNSRGNEVFTCRWMPAHPEPRALVFMCHGYAMECSISMRGIGVRLATEGYGVYGLEYEGHGHSSGLRGYIPNFDHIVDDCSHYFTAVSERQENKNKKKIILGESFGGAVALHLHLRRPDYWDMAVLLGPLCKIAEAVKPHPFLFKFYLKIGGLFPTLKVPSPDMTDEAMRVPEIRDEIKSNPLLCSGWHRLGTALEAFKVCTELEKRLDQVSLPFIVLHGGDDRVNDVSGSQLLYESARTSDKTFKLYSGMWHSLTFGELPYNINTVLSQVVAWLNQRVP